MPFRTETDSLGTASIPADAYYGVQTLRAMDNFQISGIRINQFPILIKAMAMVKKAAANANHKTGALPLRKFQTIVAACDEVIHGKFLDQFGVDVLQGGAGTSTNMNINEVITNRALELLGHAKGEYTFLHPNDDVNLAQSTNDVYPTAVRIALLFSYKSLHTEIGLLADAFSAKALEFGQVMKLGRTQLQDAVPMTLGQEFAAFATAIREDADRLQEVAKLLLEVNLGGTAVGTGINATPAYSRIVVDELRGITAFDLVRSANLLEASWDTGAFVSFSGMLKRNAVKLSKIANDLRLLSSGPRGGLGEIKLPAVQPGSSIMPWKLNPVIPEVVNQVCFQVIGNDLVVTLAAEAGQLQLNAMEPVIVYNLLTSLDLLERAMKTLRERCIVGIEAAPERCHTFLQQSVGIVTALNPLIGYDAASRIAKEALTTGRTIRQLALEAGVEASVLDTIFDSVQMPASWASDGNGTGVGINQ
jgi:aspartate ammonia-lyase